MLFQIDFRMSASYRGIQCITGCSGKIDWYNLIKYFDSISKLLNKVWLNISIRYRNGFLKNKTLYFTGKGILVFKNSQKIENCCMKRVTNLVGCSYRTYYVSWRWRWNWRFCERVHALLHMSDICINILHP